LHATPKATIIKSTVSFLSKHSACLKTRRWNLTENLDPDQYQTVKQGKKATSANTCLYQN
jgi:hypothetical protein